MNTIKNDIVRIPVSFIRNEEYPEFAHDIQKIIEKYVVEDLKIEGVVNLFKTSMLDIDKRGLTQRAHPSSAEIVQLRAERDRFGSAIVSLMMGYKKVSTASIKNDVELTIPVLEKYFNGLYKVNNVVKSYRLSLFFKDLEDNSAMKNSLQTLGFMAMLDQLETINSSYIDKMRERRTLKSEDEKIDMRNAINYSAKMMRKVFSTIETNRLVERTVDYSPIINEINETVEEYKTFLLQRKSMLASSSTKQTAASASTTTTETAESSKITL